MKNQTAVDWLVEQLKERGYAGEFPPHLLFDQAKAMEKQNMIKFANDFLFHDDTDLTAEQYYKETYGK